MTERKPFYPKENRGRKTANCHETLVTSGRELPPAMQSVGTRPGNGSDNRIINSVNPLGYYGSGGPVSLAARKGNANNSNDNTLSYSSIISNRGQVTQTHGHVDSKKEASQTFKWGRDANEGSKKKSGEEIFRVAAAAHKEVTSRHLQSAGETFSDDDDEEDDDEFDKKKDTVLSNFLTKLNKSASEGTSKVNSGDLGRTAAYIGEALKAKANICLVCIDSVTHSDPVWNCCGCYTMFHIQCIQQWIRDGVQHTSVLSAELFPKKDQPWFCPKCRHEYQQSDFPKVYRCFCGKEENPAFDAWLLPHSCGQTCTKHLKPKCSHSCLLQCHPGPCPPCPKMVESKCFCGKSPKQMRRCGSSRWSCGATCGRSLNCGHHRCPRSCHEGECGDCPETSQQPCMCGKKSDVVPCASLQWKCDEVCNKQLSCGHHKCQVVCHSGSCPPCPKDGQRICPCGKTAFNLPCTEDAPTCLETCGKLFSCGLHKCTSRCHQGSCGTCREMTRKKCRCGKREKDLQCFKEFQCDLKCPNLKDCGVHQCKRKCCDGNCTPCTAMCNKPLKCRQHKCANTCHTGPCYPCTAVVTLHCNCSATIKAVPCGVEKKTRPPRCSRSCTNPADCHHPTRTPHACHFGECPKCDRVCAKRLVACSHSCPVVCHSAVKVEVKDTQPKVGPWQVSRGAKKVEVVSLPCPPCLVPVPITCLGKHETTMVPCSEARDYSCHRQCGRKLSCLNHTCQLACHTVEGVDDSSSAGTNCTECEEPCSKPRPTGCTHQCLLTCHPGRCSACSQMVKMRCHCQMIVKHVPCGDWRSTEGRSGSPSRREELQSCGCRCPKSLPCTHRCKSLCHSGECPPAPDCAEKVKVRCPCGRKKEEVVCRVLLSGGGKTDCDVRCEEEKEKRRKEKEDGERANAESEALKRKVELEEFEKKCKGKKKQRHRRQDLEEIASKSFVASNQAKLLAAVLIVLFSFFVYKLIVGV